MTVEVGLYGKLPSHGDFLRRRVPDAFVTVWDAWLQECFAVSRAELGQQWLDVYLTSPAWRFASAAGVFGDAPVIGVMVPSVDRVGRYFHLAVVAGLPAAVDVATAAVAAEPFYAGAERLLIDTLASMQVDFTAFDRDVIDLAGELAGCELLAAAPLGGSAAGVIADGADGGWWQVPIADVSSLSPALMQVLSHRLAALYDPLVMWWTSGSSEVEPSCLIGRGLPPPDRFAALLDGGWVGWSRVGRSSAGPAVDVEAAGGEPPPRFRSAGATNVGNVRRVNQDAYLERAQAGIWAVADGVGGHEEGEVASRMVCDALADLLPDADFEQAIEGASERLRDVNAQLVRTATREHNPVRSGSTVVVLLARGTQCAILWAGDSRAYRLRGGRLDQLTRDHSAAELSGGADVAATAITRAVGAETSLSLDVYRDRVRVGDRFLLCSDGLTRVLPESQIRTSMELSEIESTVETLVAATLAAGAPDNVTAVVVDACPCA